MSEFNKMGFDPMVPLGNPSAPPPLNRSDYLLPPLPKPATPVEARPMPSMTSSKMPDVMSPVEPESTAMDTAKPPLPGKMAWVPEVMRLLTKPTKQKGIIAAGIASLVCGATVAQWMWPNKPMPTVETAAMEPVPVAVKPLFGTPAAITKHDVPPAVVSPKIEISPAVAAPMIPAIEVPKSDLPPLTLPPLKLDRPADVNVRPAGGIELQSSPVIPPVTAPVTPPATTAAPMAPPLIPTPTAPAVTPPLTPPATAPVLPTLAPPVIGVEPPKTEVKIELPKTELPKIEMPKTELPKLEIAPPSMPEFKPEVKVPVTPPAAPPIPRSEPTFVREGTTPKPVPLPVLEATVEPRTLTPTRTVTPSITPSAVAPREDYDVDVHYATAADSYSSISKQHLGDERFAEALRAYNGNRNVVNSQPVDVPPIHVLRKQFASLIATPRVVTPAGGEAIPVARNNNNNGLRSYDIPAGGMTLKALAKASLGDENLWGQIWELNPRLRADEPVPAGTRIKLPGDSRIGE